MDLQNKVIDKILELLEEKFVFDINEKIRFLYNNTYLRERRIKNILNKKVKRLTIKEIDAIAYALDVNINKIFKNL